MSDIALSATGELSLVVMKPVELMTDEELASEVTTLRGMYVAHLKQVQDSVGRATMGDMDHQLSRYFEVRSELQRRQEGGSSHT